MKDDYLKLGMIELWDVAAGNVIYIRSDSIIRIVPGINTRVYCSDGSELLCRESPKVIFKKMREVEAEQWLDDSDKYLD